MLIKLDHTHEVFTQLAILASYESHKSSVVMYAPMYVYLLRVLNADIALSIIDASINTHISKTSGSNMPRQWTVFSQCTVH